MKRHTKQDSKQALGQYHTTNADYILSGFEKYVKGKTVVDPCAGGGDLLTWAKNNGAVETIGYDIDANTGWIQRDTLMNPPDATNTFMITNPPYLSRNKAKKQYAEIYDKYKQNDLYKCHLAGLMESNCTEGIEILPANFLCESKVVIRNLFFLHYEIVEAKYWSEPVFDDATTGIVAFHFKVRTHNDIVFPMTMIPENKVVTIELKEKYGYLYGDEFFDYINRSKLEFRITRVKKGDEPPNTRFVFSLMDKNKIPQGLWYNESDPIYTDPKAFTTYQISLDIKLDEDLQRDIVKEFNSRLSYYRNKYHGLFLANYLGANQKILSVSYCNKLLNQVILDTVKIEPLAFGEMKN